MYIVPPNRAIAIQDRPCDGYGINNDHHLISINLKNWSKEEVHRVRKYCSLRAAGTFRNNCSSIEVGLQSLDKVILYRVDEARGLIATCA